VAKSRTDETEDTRVLRVLTLNCWNVSEPLEERMSVIRSGLAHERPDVIGLQEVIVRPDGFDQGALLCGHDGFARVFGAAFSWTDDGSMVSHDQRRSGFGNLIASRWPIVRSQVRRLPGTEGGEPRSATAALVQTPAGLLPVLTTHLDWEFDHGHVRERQVLAIDAFAREWSADACLPPVVLGDFNAHPDSNEMRFLRGLASLDGRSTYFQDAWEVAGVGPGHTWDNRNRFAALACEPDRRIDYVLVGRSGPEGRGRIESARLVFDVPVGDVFATDHFGVVVDLRV
jgi:endonuclease/exonuclease/phosphatase family metal-dependent hydrolase